MWIKQEANEINSLPFKKIIKKFGHEGLGIVLNLRFNFMNISNHKIKYDDKTIIEDLSLFLNFDNCELLASILNFSISQEIFLVKDGYLYDPIVLSTSKLSTEDKIERATNAANARWGKHRKSDEVVKVPEIAPPETFDKTNLDDYEGSFPVVETEIEPPKKSNNPDILALFTEACGEQLGIIPEAFRLPNKLEKQALENILEMIEDGAFNKLPDKDTFFQVTFAKIAATSKPQFYLTEFFNKVINDFLKVRKEDAKLTDQWIIGITDKYKLIGHYKF